MHPDCEYCFICPTYGQYDYARLALESFFRHTERGLAVVIDDAHPKFHRFWDRRWNVAAHPFKTRGGVTRSWNHGLRLARKFGARYTICGNDDILFTPQWWQGPVLLANDPDVGLVGPLSNGPGLSNREQNIWDHVRGYKPSDRPAALAKVAAQLRRRYEKSDGVPVSAANGFFLFARTERWWEGRFDSRHVFNPAPPYAMVHSEHELQWRMMERGWKNVVSLRSFIFHYRSVTRGDQYKRGLWYRRPPPSRRAVSAKK
ncbi:MAG TPA: hypothetical protein VHC95_13300 [Opitutales bacterium]|nr:hypothetical protein [Opitutales bacterium]